MWGYLVGFKQLEKETPSKALAAAPFGDGDVVLQISSSVAPGVFPSVARLRVSLLIRVLTRLFFRPPLERQRCQTKHLYAHLCANPVIVLSILNRIYTFSV